MSECAAVSVGEATAAAAAAAKARGGGGGGGRVGRDGSEGRRENGRAAVIGERGY